MIYIYIIYFGIWLLKIKNRYGYNVSFFLIAIYLFSFFCGLILFMFYPETIKYPERVTFLSVTSHIFLLTLFLYPITRFGNHLRIEKLYVNLARLNRYAWCVILVSMFSILASLPSLLMILSFKNLNDARAEAVHGEMSHSLVDQFGMLGYIFSLGSSISFIAIFLFFYYFFWIKKQGLLSAFLFISGLASVFSNLADAGRIGLVRWLFCMLFSFFLFKENVVSYVSCNKNNKKIFVFVLLVGILIYIFSAITIDRFGESKEGILYSLFRYYGEQTYIYSYHFHRFADAVENKGILYLFPILSQVETNSLDLNKYISADYFLNTFGTFVGSFLSRVGIYNCLLLAIISFFLLASVFNYKLSRRLYFGKFVAYLFIYEIFMMGVFYYMHWSRMTQFSILLFIALASFLVDSKPPRIRY